MNDSKSSQHPHELLTPQKASRDLYFLAGAFRGEADAVAHGKHCNEELVQLAGWTIYLAARSGLIDSVLPLEEVLEEAFLKPLDEGVPLLLQDEVSRYAGPPIIMDMHRTIEQVIQELEKKAAEASPEQPATFEGMEKPPLHLAIDAEEATGVLVMCTWRHLATTFRDQLPDDMKRLYLVGHPLSELRPQDSQGLRKAAWVCDFLAQAIAGRFGIQTQIATGAPRANDAASPPAGFLRLEDIWRNNSDLTAGEREQVRKNLENWRKKNEDRCFLGEGDLNTGRRRYAYPAAQVEIFLQRVRDKRTH